MNTDTTRYLGDGVYVQILRGDILLTTSNHEVSLADNRVILEPPIAAELVHWMKEPAPEYFPK